MTVRKCSDCTDDKAYAFHGRRLRLLRKSGGAEDPKTMATRTRGLSGHLQWGALGAAGDDVRVDLSAIEGA